MIENKNMFKDITLSEYAGYRKCTLSNISKQIRKNRNLPNVIEIKKWGRFYTLMVPIWLNADTYNNIND